jgi:hypothetical protein
MDKFSRSNYLLSNAILITSIGDYAGLFVYFIIFEQLNNDTVYSGYTIISKALAAILAFFALKYFIIRVNQKNLLIWTQFLMGFLSLFFIFIIKNHMVSNYLVIAICFIQAILFEQFKLSRDNYSKIVADKIKNNTNVYREHQAHIEFGLKIGQMFGPLAFFLIANILKFPLWAPLLLDSFSFLIAGIILFKITDIEPPTFEKVNLSKGIKVLFNKNIFNYFLIKSSLVISGSTYNILIFRLLKSKFNLDSSFIPLTYSALSIGSVTMSYFLSDSTNRNNFVKFITSRLSKQNHRLIIYGGLIFASCIFSFLFSYDFKYLPLILFFAGVGNTLQIVSMRSILHSFSSYSDFSKINPFDVINTRGLEAICTVLVIHAGFLVSDSFLISIVVILSIISAFLPFIHSRSALFKISTK